MMTLQKGFNFCLTTWAQTFKPAFLFCKTKQNEKELKMSERKMSKTKSDFVAIHKKVFVVLPRNKANSYLQTNKFTESEKNLLKKLRRNHQNKVCAQNYRLGFRERIESLEKTILHLRAQVQFYKDIYSQQHLHWKKKILQKEGSVSQE
jgi:hypothetical protein